MKKILFRTLSISALLALSSCFGAKYPYPQAYSLDGKTGEKEGKACARQFLIFQLGDKSVASAAKDADIKKISTIDGSYFSFYGIYGQSCTLVTGS